MSAIACPMASDEELVCEVLICNPIGLSLPESREECLDVNRRFAIYLATLGFWEDPPKCKFRDGQCNVVGEANNAPVIPTSFCDDLADPAERQSCLDRMEQP